MLAMYIAAAILLLAVVSQGKKEKPKENSPKIGLIPLVLLALLISLVQTIKNKITKRRNDKQDIVKEEIRVVSNIEPKKEEKVVPQKAVAKSYDEMTRAEKIDYLKKTRDYLGRQKEITKAPTKTPTKESGGKVLKKTL